MPCWPIILALLATAAWWNSQRFGERAMVPRTKDLSFLPSPVMARMLSMGHPAAAAKLRWIDSFAYFELQLDRHDDTLAGTGESGFRRLYDMLIDLDPHFELFYQHAAFNTGALENRHDIALGYLMRGTIEMPRSTALWRQAAAELHTNYQWEERQPASMEAFLDQWEAAESTYNEKRQVWDWKTAMARRQYRGLDQIGYWQDQLASSTPGSPTADYIEHTMRDQLARFAVTELQALVDAYRSRHGIPPLLLADALEPESVAARYPAGPPPWGPVTIDAGRLALRSDPFGFDLTLRDGTVTSPGLERSRAEHRMYHLSSQLAEAAKRDGRWAETLDEARKAGIEFAELPGGGAYRIVEHAVTIDWQPPPRPAWRLRPQNGGAPRK